MNRDFKIISIAVICVAAAFWATAIFVEAVKRPIIQKSTEQKYLRNLDKFYPINDGHFTTSYIYDDTLGFIAKIPFYLVDPFRRWYIEDVGAIPRSSELSRKLDSMINLYVKQPSKYK